MKLWFCLVILEIPVIWCLDYEYRIMGGENVSNISKAPYQVQYGFYCGAVLISKYWAITAAHCSEKTQFILGGSSMLSHGTLYKVCKHFTHPGWKDPKKEHSHDYDYQLLKLCTPVFSYNTPAIIGNMDEIIEGAPLVVTGWGHLNSRAKKMQDNLRRVVVPVLSQKTCRQISHWVYQSITPRMFCAGLRNGTKDACQGDSGGPAMINGKLVGLVSFGIGCGERERPGVYSNVPLVRGWIQNVTGLPL